MQVWPTLPGVPQRETEARHGVSWCPAPALPPLTLAGKAWLHTRLQAGCAPGDGPPIISEALGPSLQTGHSLLN